MNELELEKMTPSQLHDFYYNQALEQAKQKYLPMSTEELRREIFRQREIYRLQSIPRHKTVAACEVIYEELKKREVII